MTLCASTAVIPLCSAFVKVVDCNGIKIQAKVVSQRPDVANSAVQVADFGAGIEFEVQKAKNDRPIFRRVDKMQFAGGKVVLVHVPHSPLDHSFLQRSTLDFLH